MSLMPAMLPHWLSKLLPARQARGDYAVSSSMHSRIEICPPELWPSSLSWRGRLTRWLNNSRWLPEPARPMHRLAMVKAEFREAVFGVDAELLDGLDERIERARSLREFWHLRSPLYNVLAMGLNQMEADRRLALLNRHFPRRAPRNASVTVAHVAPAISAATLAVIESAAARSLLPVKQPAAATESQPSVLA